MAGAGGRGWWVGGVVGVGGWEGGQGVGRVVGEGGTAEKTRATEGQGEFGKVMCVL